MYRIPLDNDPYFIFWLIFNYLSNISLFVVGLIFLILLVVKFSKSKNNPAPVNLASRISNSAESTGFFSKNKRILITIIAILFVGFLPKFLFSFKQASTDNYMNLAQAESTLIQNKVMSTAEKKPLNYDRTKGDQWINNMRFYVSSGDLSLGAYYSLAIQFNDLKVGLTQIKEWFKTNSSESIQKELEQAIQNRQAQMQATTNTDGEVSFPKSDLDNQIEKAFGKP